MSFSIFLPRKPVPQGIRIYNQDDPPEAGLYIGLFHGRWSHDEVLEDWGFNGPIIGPLEYVHTTYASHIKFEFVHPADAIRFDRALGVNRHFSELCWDRHDLVPCNGALYGDMTVFYHSPKTSS